MNHEASTAPLTIIRNDLPLSIDVYGFNPAAGAVQARFAGTVDPGDVGKFPIVDPFVRVLLTASGAIVSMTPRTEQVTTPTTIIVDALILTGPFMISPPPQISQERLMPPDSQPWAVGVGEWVTASDDGNVRITFTREQFWRKSPESFSLPPKSFVQKTMTQVSGRTGTSSTSEQIRAELGMSVSAGWGPFSAAASASLSASSQRTDTVTIHEGSSVAIDQFISNDTAAPVVVCFWQLIERLRLLKSGDVTEPDGSTRNLDVCIAAVDSGIVPMIPMSFSPAPV